MILKIKFVLFAIGLLVCCSLTISAQEKYFEVISTSSTYFDDEKNEVVQDEFVRQEKILLSEDYMLYFRNPTFEEGPFSFSHLDVLERATGRTFQLRNSYRNLLFKRFRSPDIDIFSTFKPTGKIKLVNSQECEEYLGEYNGKKLYTYVSKDLPFVNIFGTKTHLPGFVVSYQMILSMKGKEYVRTEEFELREFAFDSTYFKYMDELKKQHPPLPVFKKSLREDENHVPTWAIEFISEDIIDVRSTPFGMEKTKGVDCNGVRSLTKIMGNDLRSKSYFNRAGQLNLQMASNGSWVVNVKENLLINCNEKRDNNYLELNSELDTIFHSNHNQGYFSIYDKKSNTVIVQNPKFGSVGRQKINANDKLISEIWINEQRNSNDTLLYFYYDSGRLKQRIKKSYVNGELKDSSNDTYFYNENGLLKEVVRDGKSEKYYYKSSSEEKEDWVHVYVEFEEGKEIYYSYCFDERKNLVSRVQDYIKDVSISENKIEYYDTASDSHASPTEKVIAEAFENAYLDLFFEMDSIRANEANAKVGQMCRSNFLIKKILKEGGDQSSLKGFNFFPDIQYLSSEKLKEDENISIYKVNYKESIDGFVDRSSGHYRKTMDELINMFGDKIVVGNPLQWRMTIERSSRYAIIKQDKSTGKWIIN